MLEKIKLALRYSNNLFDDEVNGLIAACKNDLERVGVSLEKLYDDEAVDPAILNAVICFCKWQLNFQRDGERWGKLYREIRQDIALDGDYKCQRQ